MDTMPVAITMPKYAGDMSASPASTRRPGDGFRVAWLTTLATGFMDFLCDQRQWVAEGEGCSMPRRYATSS